MIKNEDKIVDIIDSKNDSKASFDDIKNSNNPKKKVKVLAIILASISGVISLFVITILVIALLMPNVSMIDGKYRTLYIHPGDNISENTSTSDTAYVKRWEERSLLEKYTSFIYNDMTYDIWSTYSISSISSSYIESFLSSSIATGYDFYKGEMKETYIDVYKIKQINENAAIAIRFIDENDDYFYPVVNNSCNFGFVDQFIDYINLKEYGSFGDVYYEYTDKKGKLHEITFENVDNEYIYNFFFKDNHNEVLSDITMGYNKIKISFSNEVIGRKNLSLSLDNEGYAYTNMFAYSRKFYVCENALEKFVKYLDSNYQGYEYLY